MNAGTRWFQTGPQFRRGGRLETVPEPPCAPLVIRQGGGPTAAALGAVAFAAFFAPVFENIGVVLDESTLLPDLSAALYRAVAKFPGVRVVESVKGGAGLTGIGLTYTSFKSSSTSASESQPSEGVLFVGGARSPAAPVGAAVRLRRVRSLTRCPCRGGWSRRVRAGGAGR